MDKIGAGAISEYSQSSERAANELGCKRYGAAQYDLCELVKGFVHLLAEVKVLERTYIVRRDLLHRYLELHQ